MFKKRSGLLLLIPCLIMSSGEAASAKELGSSATRLTQSWSVRHFDPNNIDATITNYGVLFFDPNLNSWGFEWPKGSGLSPIFASGIWMGAKVNGEIRVAGVQYSSSEFAPGTIDENTHLPNDPNDPTYRVYKINRGDTVSWDYRNWPYWDGAPVDPDGKPRAFGDQTLWAVFNDADSANHSEFGTDPLGVEIQQTVFGWSPLGAPIGNLVILRWLIINKSGQVLDSAYISAWSDPDVGDAEDDLVGCDTTLSLGYCYNATNNDQVYGANPPATGYGLLQGPIVPSPGDSAIFMGEWRYGYKNLPMSSFVSYQNHGGINGNPQTGEEVYNYMRARWRDGSQITYGGDGTDPNNPPTNFMFTGDPETGTGWLDFNESDRRFLISSGPFTMMPGDSQEVVMGVLISRGTSNLNSVTLLKQEDDFLQFLYNDFFIELPHDVITKINYPNINQAQINVQVYVPSASQVSAEFYDHSDIFISTLTLFDDGLHNDELPNDGIWGNQLLINRRQTALYMDLIVDYPNLGNLTWSKVAHHITVAGPVAIPFPIIGADNINENGQVNPGEAIRYTTYVHNQSPFDLQIVWLEQFSAIEGEYVHDLAAPNGNKVFSVLNAGQTTSWGYDPNSAFYQFTVSPDIPTTNDIHIVIKITDDNYNVWYDTLAFDVYPFLHPPQYGTMNLISGITEGRLGYILTDPGLLTGHTYQAYIHEHPDELVYGLIDVTVNDTLLHDTAFPDPYAFNSPIVDGFKVTRGTAMDRAHASDWEWTPSNQRWLSGLNWGGAIFFGSADLGENFIGGYFFSSTLKSWEYRNTLIIFDPAMITNCKVYRRDLGYTVQPGLGTFSGQAYDIRDPNNPRRLNIVFVEDNNEKPADMIWNPDDTDFGSREYLFIMNSDYDPVTAGGYDDVNWGPAADVIFGYWPRVESGHSFMENPAELKFLVNAELVYDGVLFEFTPQWTTVEEKDALPLRFELLQNYPNPFNPTTNIRFSLAHNAKVKLEVFNVLGQIVKTIVNKKMNAGRHVITWNGRNEQGKQLGSGIYFYRLQADDFVKTRKMILLK